MRSDVHNAALRAAAKVAFSMAFLTTGCAASTELGTVGAPDNDADDDGYASTESDISKSKPKAPKIATGGCSKKKDPPKQSCEQLINAAFPTEGDYPGTKQNVSKEVQACCADLLTKPGDDGLGMTAHRWDCCANATPGADIMMACTPWGPPVPPSMKRRGQKPTPPDAWIARLTESRLAEVA